MAFNIFKKKEDLDYPEEKASVLEKPFEAGPESELGPPPEIPPLPQPPMGALPPPPTELEIPPMEHKKDFGSGFVPMDKMAPPELPDFTPTMPQDMESSMSASLRPPEEMDFPEPRRESIFKPEPRIDLPIEKPHVFIRIL